MTDDKNRNDKVINLFKKSLDRDDTSRQRFFKGFQYVKLTKDDNGNYFKEENLREYAQKCYYIISVMKNNGIGVALYKYKVPYSSLLDFFNVFRNNELYGEIVDIERYIPEDLA
ncbi:MAG: hypothetical protein ACI37R_03655 [Candidatus Avigastranaerophilus sp.]